jgi:RHS repeat-associated protein
VTNQTGAVVSRHDYLPYGWELYSGLTGRTNGHGYLTSPEGVPTPTQRFTGKERDSETRLDYFGARYYSAGPGRFTSADAPFADQFPENPQSWNLFAYVRNNPSVYIDPNGKQTMMGGTTFVPSGKEVDTFIGLAKGYVNSLLQSENLDLGVVLRAAGVKPQVASNPQQQAGMNAYPAVESAVVIGMAVLPIVKSARVGSSTAEPAGLLPAPRTRGNPNRAEADAPVKIVVDPKGNAIPLKHGETTTGSPDGQFIQVRDAAGKPTGLRLDGAHKPQSHPDPRAQRPHAHVPGVTNPDGTPWLPVNQ